MAENRFLDDIAKFSNSTLTAMGSMQKQVRNWVSEQVEALIDNMDLVTKKELTAQNTRLLTRIEELEAKIAKLDTSKPAKVKTASKAKVKQ